MRSFKAVEVVKKNNVEGKLLVGYMVGMYYMKFLERLNLKTPTMSTILKECCTVVDYIKNMNISTGKNGITMTRDAVKECMLESNDFLKYRESVKDNSYKKTDKTDIIALLTGYLFGCQGDLYNNNSKIIISVNDSNFVKHSGIKLEEDLGSVVYVMSVVVNKFVDKLRAEESYMPMDDIQETIKDFFEIDKYSEDTGKRFVETVKKVVLEYIVD